MKSIFKIAPLIVILSGCIDDNNEIIDDNNSPTSVISSLSFSYIGDFNGMYSVQGDALSWQTRPIYDYNWAVGIQYEEFGKKWTNILSNRVSPNSYRSFPTVQMAIPDQGVGKYKIPNSEGINGISLEYSPNWDGLLHFSFVSGEVNITYYQGNRIIGTFSGELNSLHNGDTVNISVREGEFDVKLSTGY